MNNQNKVEAYKIQVNASINDAEKKISRMDWRLREHPGPSGVVQRNFLNNICSIQNAVYLELGAYRGVTSISAVSHNDTAKGYCVDNFKFDQFNIKKEVPEEGFGNIINGLRDNIKRYKVEDQLTILHSDIEDLNLEDIKEKVDIIFYDCPMGESSIVTEHLSKVLPSLDDVFILIIGYFNNVNVTRKGVDDFIKNQKLINHFKETKASQSTGDSIKWWAGMGIFILEKVKVEITLPKKVITLPTKKANNNVK